MNFEARKRIIEEIPELKKCFQCGTCVSSCPAKIYSGDFSPRGFILECLHGAQQGVMNDNLWKCITCNNCNERCPQGVNPYEVIVKLKNIAIRDRLASKEKINDSLRAFENVKATGIAYPVSELAEKKRKELGLRPLKDE